MSTLALTPSRGGLSDRWLFTLAILTGSFLLFCVQPLMARLALPRLGGAPAVWNSAMLVYQALLLAGYGWAHWLGRFPLRRQMLLHGALLLVAALWLPLGLATLPPPAPGVEALWVPLLFILSIGPVFVAVAAQAPLLQRWFAAEPGAGDPYALYAASNLGSFGGLLSYPLVLEPALSLDAQQGWWTAGYGVLVLLVALVAWTRRATPDAAVDTAATALPAQRIDRRRIMLWLALSAVPSGLMLSTTTHLTTDVFAMPLIWVIPLSLYLLSFTVAFSERRALADVLTLIAPIVLLLGGGLALLSAGGGTLVSALSSLVTLAVVAVALHARLHALRPPPDQLTRFYLVMATGGVLGGLFAALIAPVLFDWVYEHPILLLSAGLLLPMQRLVPWQDWVGAKAVPISLALLAAAVFLIWRLGADWSGKFDAVQITLYGAIVLVGALLVPRRLGYVATLGALMLAVGGADTLRASADGIRTRSYFGVYTIREDAAAQARTLAHGTTLHGVQRTAPGTDRQPTSYYGATSGVGLALAAAPRLFGPDVRVGVVGLGTGTLACYATAGARYTFFEIDPAIVTIARGRPFTFLPQCAPEAPVVVGDARLKLAEAAPGSYDVLVIDAFSSDAIPLHLLTAEALAIYTRALAPDGLLLLHISNRYFGLEPPVAAAVAAAGLHGAIRSDHPADIGSRPDHLTGSDWIAISRDKTRLGALTGPLLVDRVDVGDEPIWHPLAAPPGTAPWTDNRASVLPAVRWENLMGRH